jgi:hypothetical protein
MLYFGSIYLKKKGKREKAQIDPINGNRTQFFVHNANTSKTQLFFDLKLKKI